MCKKINKQVLPILSELVDYLNGLYDSKDPRDYGWKEHDAIERCFFKIVVT